MWVFRKVYHLEEYITKKHFVAVGVIMLVLAAFFGYFTFSDYLTKWYGSEKNDELLIQLLFKKFYWPFIISNYIGVLLPLLVVGIAKFRTITNITLTSIVVIIALWLNRYIIVVPTLESPYLPIQDSRPEWLNYSATWVEWSLTATGVAVFCLLFTLASKFITIVPVAGLQKEEKNEDVLI